jgi:hypothetical protein
MLYCKILILKSLSENKIRNPLTFAQFPQSLVAVAHDAARPVACPIVRFIVTGHKFARAVSEPVPIHRSNYASFPISDKSIFHKH